MSLRARLQMSTIAAMKAKDAARLSALRMISAAIKDREIAVRADAGEVNDGDILALLGKMVKQRSESARAYADGGRAELAAKNWRKSPSLRNFCRAKWTPPRLKRPSLRPLPRSGQAHCAIWAR